VPDRSLTPKKAMARFEKLQATLVGALRLELDPTDARILVDGKEVVPGESGVLRLVAGERALRVERKGFDPADLQVRVAPGPAAPMRVALVPNARTLVIRTDPDHVAVRLGGKLLGETVRPAGPDEPLAQGRPAELVVEDAPAGEHMFELDKPCFRSARLRVAVTVDLMDRSPMVLDPVVLEAARSQLVLSGGPAGAEVLVDGIARGRLPVEPIAVCPGPRRIEIVGSGRMLWAKEVTIADEGDVTEEIVPRPNAVVVGAAGWPQPLAELGETFTARGTLPLPEGIDLTSASGWESVTLPPDADIVLAVLPPTSRGEAPRLYLYSPVLKRLAPVVSPMRAMTRPSWHRTSIGVRLADSTIGGTALVVAVIPDGTAASAGIAKGDRILEVAGAPVEDARRAIARIESQAVGMPFEVKVLSPAGATRVVSCTGSASPRLGFPSADEPVSAVVLAAWASVDAVASASDGPIALSNLALLLSEAELHARAVEVWQRARWGARAGIGDGTASYYLGRELEAMKREREAREAFRRASESKATAFSDDGPDVSPAALDHLVDLGVATP
jgi:hypothetical protein